MPKLLQRTNWRSESGCETSSWAGRVGSANPALAAKRKEKRMVEACERRILEFLLGMDPREVAKELKREGWY